MIKVLFICSSLERTGPTNQLLNIISALHNKVDYTIITLSEEPLKSLKNKFLDLGVNVYCVTKNKFGFFSQFKEINRYVKNNDIVQTQGIRADFLSAILGRKNIATLRNYPFEDYPPLYGNCKGKLMAYAHLFALKFMHTRVTVSDSTAEKNRAKTGLVFSVIYNGVDVNKFAPADNNIINHLKKQYELAPGKRTIVYTGPLIERKNVASLINIIKIKPNLQLIIAGDGPLRKDLIELASADNIIFTGAVENISEILSLADCYAMLSNSEGFPNSVMEALSIGLPCVLSDIPSHQDVKRIVTDGVKLFSSTESLTSFLDLELDNFLSCNSRAELRNKTIEKLSSEIMANEYFTLYKSVMNSGLNSKPHS